MHYTGHKFALLALVKWVLAWGVRGCVLLIWLFYCVNNCEYKTFIFSQSHFVCACVRVSVQPPGIVVLLFCISSDLVERCSKRAGTRTVHFFFLLSVLRRSRQPYLGSLCRLNHYTSRWEVVLWASHWFIYSADSFRNDTTVWRSEFSVANIATFFQKSTWTKFIWCQTHLYCLTSMFYNPNDIFKCKYRLNRTTSIVFIRFVWWFGQTYRIII